MTKKNTRKKKSRSARQHRPAASSVAGLLTTALDHQRNGAYEKAQALYQRILTLAPKHDDAWHLSGLLEYQRGKYDLAIDRIRRAIALNPRISLYHYNLGVVGRDSGDLTLAAAAFRIARQLNPSDPDIALCFANVLRALGRFDDAVNEYSAVLSAVPDDVDAARALTAMLSAYAFTRYDAGYDALFNRLLNMEGIDCQMLARPVASLLVRKYPLISAPGAMTACQSEEYSRLASDPLLLTFMNKVINTSVEMEALLTALRSQLIRNLYVDGQLPDRDLELAACLAQQCLNNDHVFSICEVDREGMAWLRQQLAGLPGPTVPLTAGEELRLMVYAMFEPLDRLPAAGILMERSLASWSPPVRSVVLAGLYERAAEQALRADIESISVSANEVSAAVQAMYEESPYPRWLAIRDHDLTDYRRRIEMRFPRIHPITDTVEFRRILIAGCGTGRHPIEVARANPGASVLAIDLSAASLAYGLKMARRLGVDNIRFLRGDLLSIEKTGLTFDVIECVGVLHHMEDPLQGWRALYDRLMAGGLMRIGLYSSRARSSVTRCREYVTKLGLLPDKNGIDRLRRDILAGVLGDKVRGDMIRWSDFYSTCGVRDLLFHVQEHQYTLPLIEEYLHDLQLEFIGFDPLSDDIRRKYQDRFGSDDHLAVLERWDEIERENPDVFRGMYQFWCRKVSDDVMSRADGARRALAH